MYLPLWYFENRFGKEKKPLQTVIFITECCNLNCRHCAQNGHAKTGMKPYKTIEKELQYAYDQGARFVDFEGGEPTLWREGQRGLNDLIYLAKRIGYFSTTVTTNGQTDFSYLDADAIWVSVDGYKKYHDLIRGEGTFEKLNRNIAKCGHPAVSINMDINKLNYKSVLDVIRYATKSPYIQSVSLNFHTPYEGTEDLMLDWDIRCRVIDRIIEMKRDGYHIMNSISGLKLMKKHDFEKNCWISSFILMDGTYLAECPGKTVGVCDRCGFCMAGEMSSLMKLRPDTVLAGLNLRMKDKKQ
jgi:MoaA/NifB/PqqE/SkfB family radical SAM enzyme